MTAKKSIALLIALAMAVAMLAGCSSGTPTDANDPASAGSAAATDVRQKASLLIAAGEYPDLLTTSDASGDLKAAGAFVPLNDYIANSTNIKNCYTESQIKLMTQEDGNIYWFGNHASEIAVYPTAGYYLNMDLLAQAGYPQVTTFEQWQQLIIDYVEANPTYKGQSTIGITEPTEAWRASAVQYGGSRFLAGYQYAG